MDTCNMIFNGMPAKTYSSTPVSDIQLSNMYSFFTDYAAFIPILLFFFTSVSFSSACIIGLFMFLLYLFLGEELEEISRKYDYNCSLPLDSNHPYFV